MTGHAPYGDDAAVPLLRLIVVLTLVALMAGCDPPPAAPDSVEISPLPLAGSRMPADPIPAVFRLPAGKGPFPAVIVLHGCGGRGASQLIWAQRLNSWGYAALIPDSMTSRGVKSVCAPAAQELVTPRDRVSDVGAAAAWLRERPEIDPGRIAVLGQSHGGTAALMATERGYAEFRLRAAVDYYGPCVGAASHGTVPVLVLVGGADDWGHPEAHCLAFKAALKPDQRFELLIYPGAYHAFENPEMVRTVSNSHVMEYNPAAAEDSFIHVRAFLDHFVRR